MNSFFQCLNNSNCLQFSSNNNASFLLFAGVQTCLFDFGLSPHMMHVSSFVHVHSCGFRVFEEFPFRFICFWILEPLLHRICCHSPRSLCGHGFCVKASDFIWRPLFMGCTVASELHGKIGELRRFWGWKIQYSIYCTGTRSRY